MWTISQASAYGGILLTRGGRILLREPTNHYDGYVWTYAKGRPDKGDMPEQTALREVREETGYEAEIVDVLPGVFKGGTTTNAFFVMRHIGPPGGFDERETASVRWVDFHDAEALIGQTTNSVGRVRDLAILQAAQAWFEANRTVVLPDDEWLPFPARKSDWKTQEMPVQHVVLALDFTLTAQEAARVRLGYIPEAMEEKWFSYFEDNALHQHRSWTGYCIDQIHFVPEGDGLRATQVTVNRDPEQHGGADDREDAHRIENMVRELAHRDREEDLPPSSLMQAIELASQPNYLGSPEIVASLIEELFQVHQAAITGEAKHSDKMAANTRLTRIMTEDGTAYTRMPGWHTETALGQNIIEAFGLDPDYCKGESLAFIVTEGIAALGMVIDALYQDVMEKLTWEDDPVRQEAVAHPVQDLFRFAVEVFMGTQKAGSPGKTLQNFQLRGLA